MVLDIDASNEPKKSKKKILSSASYTGMMLDGHGPSLKLLYRKGDVRESKE